eukprot:323736_1
MIMLVGACRGQNIDIFDIETFRCNNINKIPIKNLEFIDVRSCKIYYYNALIFDRRIKYPSRTVIWTKYIYSIKHNKCNEIAFPFPPDVFPNKNDYDVISFGWSENIVDIILQQQLRDLFTSYPSDIIHSIILFTADECVYFMDYTKKKHFKIET